jgi:hypothetical protein
MGCVIVIRRICLRLHEVKQKLANKKLSKRQHERSISSRYGGPAELKCKAKEENNQSLN